MYDTEVQKKFITLRAKGKNLDEIALELGVSKRSLNNWNKKHEEAIIKAEDTELEELTQKLKINKGQRLRSFARMIEQLDSELSGRNLKEITTQSLIVLKIKAMEAVGKTLDSSKIEFGNALEIKEDKFTLIWKQTLEADIDDFTKDQLNEALKRKSIDNE